MKRIIWMFAAAMVMLMSGCSKNDDPNNGDYIKPDQNVADPTGTILLSMRNNNETSLDGLQIGKDDNFSGNGWQIASLGKMNGLGNVSTIPVAGWSDKVAVIPGCGYVAHNYYSNTYYRIYVTDYITSTSGGVIGADVKYQKPFKGLDEDIRIKQDKVVLPAEGGFQQIVFENNSIIPFEVSSSEEWCHVNKASTYEQSFLTDAIVISCDESYSTAEATATVTIETLYGKIKEIQVTRSSRGEFITLSQESINFPFSSYMGSMQVNIYTNVEPSDITIDSSEVWLSASFTGGSYAPQRIVRWIEEQTATRANLENPVSKGLLIAVEGYAGAVDREGTITLSYGDTKATLVVTQAGSAFNIDQTDFIFEGDKNLTRTVNWSGNIYYGDLKTKILPEGENWISASISYNQLTLTLQPNPYPEKREATLVLLYQNEEVISLNVTQNGSTVSDQYVYFESPASNYTVSFPVKPGSVITSSADWCSASPNGASLVIRVQATTEDRSAVISVKGVDAKIYVSQSKYKVGDTYTLGDINASVYSMEEGKGRITTVLTDKYSWSKENVNIGCNSWIDGRVNMEVVKAIPGWRDLYPAFAAVDDLNKDGVIGWYLPANLEYASEKIRIHTWSSTQMDWSKAYSCKYYTSETSSNYYTKSESFTVVAMNTFSYDFSEKARNTTPKR